MKDLTTLYDKLVIQLEKKNVPARIKLTDCEIVVECGFDYPDRLADKIFTVIEKLTGNPNSNIISVCAEQSGSTVIKKQNICGGPKRYSRY